MEYDLLMYKLEGEYLSLSLGLDYKNLTHLAGANSQKKRRLGGQYQSSEAMLRTQIR